MSWHGRLDRYVGAAVREAWLASAGFLVFLIVLFDLLLSFGDYLDTRRQLGMSWHEFAATLGRYYAMSLPIFFVTVAPYVTVISCMFAVSKLMAANEVVSMIFTGRSMLRVLRPVVLVAVFSGLAMAACWELVLPPLIEPLAKTGALLKDGRREVPLENLVLRVGKAQDQVLFVDVYRPERERMEGVTLYDAGSIRDDTRVVRALAANWNPELRDWELEGGEEFAGRVETRLPRLGVAGVAPDLLLRAGKEGRSMSELSYSDLLDLQDLRPGRRDYVLAFHHHLTFPLANLVLLFLALPFAVHFERGSRVERVLWAILVCAAYLVVDLTCRNLGLRQYLHPIAAAWIPTILFGSLGVVFFGGMRT